MTSWKVLLQLIAALNTITLGLSVTQQPKLLIVSYDAFRYDYFSRTHFMKKLKEESTHVDYMRNIFVTKTFPNHHTMATGLYAESHGVIGNEFLDPETGNVTTYSYKLFHYDNSVLPIWTINEKSGNGRHSGTMMWPGGIFPYQQTSPTFAQDFNETIPWEKRIDTLISWFLHPINPINLGILYIEEPDYHGHIYGIDGPVFNQILLKLDNITQYLHSKLDENGLHDVNVIHLSDHGMASVTLDRIINLDNYINSTDYKLVGTSPGLHIYPNPGKEKLIYDYLKAAAKETKTFRVYKREEIPAKYHYGKNMRNGPIFIIANVGYAFQNLLGTIEYYKKVFNITVDKNSTFGLHGYDNAAVEMHPMFFARGPAFIPECKLEPFNNTDLFPLFCKILDLECPPVNGTVTHLTKCLRSKTKYVTAVTYQMIFVTITLLITLVGVIIAIMMFFIRKRRTGLPMYRRSYYTMNT